MGQEMTEPQGHIRIRVPASTSNMGAGFDCFGMAVNLFLSITCSRKSPAFRIHFTGEGAESVPRTKRNLIYKAFVAYFRKVKIPVPAVTLDVRNDIPLNRGLGSSGAAIIGGLLCAHRLTGKKLSKDELLKVAARIEGHPDNVAASFYRGFTICCQTPEEIIVQKITPPRNLKMIAVVPEINIATKAARDILPKRIALTDAVSNIQRAASFVQFLHAPQWKHLNHYLDDRLHQPFRAQLIPGYTYLSRLAREYQAGGMYISGSGPTMITIAVQRQKEFREKAVAYYKKKGISCRTIALQPVL